MPNMIDTLGLYSRLSYAHLRSIPGRVIRVLGGDCLGWSIMGFDLLVKTQVVKTSLDTLGNLDKFENYRHTYAVRTDLVQVCMRLLWPSLR